MTMYPTGYGNKYVSLADLKKEHGDGMHPEYSRRLFAWIEAQGGKIGIGDGWRPTPSDTSQASREGKSFHQTQTFASGKKAFAAVDLVGANGNSNHRTVQWSEVPKQNSGDPDIANFGVHCNVDGEPWHMQCVEMDGWQTWVNNGRKDPKANYPINGGGSGGGGGTGGGDKPDLENGDYGLFPLDPNKPTIAKGSNDSTSGDKVSYLQAVLRNECQLTIDIDGHFGSETEAKVKMMQGWNGLQQDGRCGPKTWAAVDKYAT